ncbi:MAG: MarR family transcriptional regulator [Mycobacterium sp.]|uniref:MarR family winged helix-turn-helix transcriptional regulator n=1 Tax=Mycobacterium sp. TaxID=1785 RepID=UPI003BB218B0
MLLVRHLARGSSLAPRTVLATLEEDGPTRLTALAAPSGVSQPAMTQLVGRLERDGLVVRLVDPDDARATLVDITGAGRAYGLSCTRPKTTIWQNCWKRYPPKTRPRWAWPCALPCRSCSD